MPTSPGARLSRKQTTPARGRRRWSSAEIAQRRTITRPRESRERDDDDGKPLKSWFLNEFAQAAPNESDLRSSVFEHLAANQELRDDARLKSSIRMASFAPASARSLRGLLSVNRHRLSGSQAARLIDHFVNALDRLQPLAHSVFDRTKFNAVLDHFAVLDREHALHAGKLHHG